MAFIGGRSASEEVNLLKRVMNRDAEAFAILYDKYSTLLYSLIISVVKVREEAEDVLQECFEQAWQKATMFDVGRGSVYTWLVTMARNRAIDRIRSRSYRIQRQENAGHETGVEVLADPGSDSPLDILVTEERSSHVKRALEQLPADQRDVIHIAYFGGLSQSEIAEKLNLPLGTVKTRMRQGMIKLYRLLKERT